MSYIFSNSINSSKVTFCCTTKELNFKTVDNPDLKKNIQKLKTDFNLYNLVLTKQVHGNKIVVINNSISNKREEADGIMTNIKNVGIGIRTADCIPLAIYDEINQAIAILHLGRKGLVNDLLEIALQKMGKYYNSNIINLKFVIFPHIHKKNYFVTKEAYLSFPNSYYTELPKGEIIVNNENIIKEKIENNELDTLNLNATASATLDLTNFLIDKLIDLGAESNNIEFIAKDSFSSNDIHSYRRDYPNNGLMITIGFLR
jgi:polyphenol oxidase